RQRGVELCLGELVASLSGFQLPLLADYLDDLEKRLIHGELIGGGGELGAAAIGARHGRDASARRDAIKAVPWGDVARFPFAHPAGPYFLAALRIRHLDIVVRVIGKDP